MALNMKIRYETLLNLPILYKFSLCFMMLRPIFQKITSEAETMQIWLLVATLPVIWPVIDRSYYRWRYGIFCFWDSRFANMIQLWLKNFRNGICQTSIRTDLCLLLKRSINQRFTNSLAFGEFSKLTGHTGHIPVNSTNIVEGKKYKNAIFFQEIDCSMN